MGRNSITGIPGIVPKEGINRSGIGKKISRVKWDFFEVNMVNLEECGKVNHSGIEEENLGNITKVEYEERQKKFWKVCLHWCKKK